MFKGKLKGAVKGHSLLKKKSDALKIKFRKIVKDLVDVFFFFQCEVLF